MQHSTTTKRKTRQINDAPYTRQILGTTASDQDHTMFLQIMAFTLDVGHEGFARGQLDPCHFTLGRVGFLGFGDDEPGHDTLSLGGGLEQGRFGLRGFLGLAFVTHRLVHRAPCCWGCVES
jgi:hypothetical protein